MWAYPATSNRLATVKQGAATVRAFAYAANGAVTQDVRGGSTYAYGQRYAGTLSAVSLNGGPQATYLSDAFRRLRVRTLTAATSAPGTTHLVWDIFGHVIAEHVVGTGLAREYIWLGDMPLAVVDATAAPAKVYFVHVDHLDRPALMTNSARQTVWKASYEPFGAVRSIIGSAALDLRFPGQWFQLESGLAYNWNRHYDPSLGRYIQPDPLGFVDGPSLYGYAGGNPLRFIDPLGLADGHHWVTGPIRNNPELSNEARDVFRKAKTGYYGERHGWDKGHSEYNKGVQDLWKSKGYDPATMTTAQAKDFVREIRQCPDPRVAQYRAFIYDRALKFLFRRPFAGRGGSE